MCHRYKFSYIKKSNWLVNFYKLKINYFIKNDDNLVANEKTESEENFQIDDKNKNISMKFGEFYAPDSTSQIVVNMLYILYNLIYKIYI